VSGLAFVIGMVILALGIDEGLSAIARAIRERGRDR
jgi:hypothetical protein